MNLSGHTQHYAVLGHPIGHTLSPVMHNASFRSLDLDAVYLAFDVAPERLMTTLPAMADMGFRGVNLTVPLKEVAFRGLSNLDESARRLGSVNTVEFTPQGLKGHSTDGQGFLLALRETFALRPKGLSVFVLGCGGAGRAVAIACAREGAAHLTLADADATRARMLADEMAALAPQSRVEPTESNPTAWLRACSRADLIVHATPVGMQPNDKTLLGPEAFRKGQHVYDLIYMVPETVFMKAAREGGAETANGLGMLLHQGAFSFTIWTGQTPDIGAMRQALEKAVYR